MTRLSVGSDETSSRERFVGERRRAFKPMVDDLEDRHLLTILPHGFNQQEVATGLKEPTAFALASGNRIFVAEETGVVRVIQDGHLIARPVLKIPTDPTVLQGLDGIAVDPNFAQNHYIYIYYTVPGSSPHNQLDRFTVRNNVAVASSETTLLVLPSSGDGEHNGGSMQFGSDEDLYIGVGDNDTPADPQSLDSVFGKILRIEPDGAIPTDNPFYDETTGLNRAIWAIGLRNPFTSAVQPGTGQFFINDVGNHVWEKVDRGVAGGNYGWPITENATDDPQFQQPVYAYQHGPDEEYGCAITGGTFYDPRVSNFPTADDGDYFFADYCGCWIHQLDPATGVVTDFAAKLPDHPVDLAVNSGGGMLVLSRGRGVFTGSVVVIKHV
jgi:glucose/arabinose dehydrogenase